MVLQRQGEFDKKQTSSTIADARVVEPNVLEDAFDTPHRRGEAYARAHIV